MSEITQEINRSGYRGQVRVTIDRPETRLTDDDWSLMGKIAATIIDHDSETGRRVGFNKDGA